MKKLPPEERKMPEYPEKDKGGRPCELTEEVIKIVSDSLLRGNYFETAMAAAGFHPDSGYAWLKKAKKDDGIFRKFSDAVRKAEAEAEARDVLNLEIHAHGSPAKYDSNGNLIRAEIKRDVRVSQWRLERKHPKRWGRTDKLEHSGKDGEPISFVDLVRKAHAERAEKAKEEDPEE